MVEVFEEVSKLFDIKLSKKPLLEVSKLFEKESSKFFDDIKKNNGNENYGYGYKPFEIVNDEGGIYELFGKICNILGKYNKTLDPVTYGTPENKFCKDAVCIFIINVLQQSSFKIKYWFSCIYYSNIDDIKGYNLYLDTFIDSINYISTGKDLKNNGLFELYNKTDIENKTRLTKIVNMCDCNKLYIIPSPLYSILLDYEEKTFTCSNDCMKLELCNKKNNSNSDIIMGIVYIYVILPNEDIIFIKRDNDDKNKINTHTNMTCGGPIISGGEFTLGDGNVVNMINNSSGHYRPDLHSFNEGLNIFVKKKLIPNKFTLSVNYNGIGSITI